MTPEQTALLEAPLDPAHVTKAKAGGFGPKGDYLEGWHVINELNRVFGFGGWSYTIYLTKDALEQAKNTKGDMQWQAAYTCVCTLTAGDAVRQDVGFGSGFAKQIGDAIEGATKEAVTDSLKRCARSFGNVFGLALYDKSRANVHAAPVATITDEQRDEITLLANGAGVPLGTICAAAKVDSLKGIPGNKYDSIIKKLRITMDENAKQKEPANA